MSWILTLIFPSQHAEPIAGWGLWDLTFNLPESHQPRELSCFNIIIFISVSWQKLCGLDHYCHCNYCSQFQPCGETPKEERQLMSTPKQESILFSFLWKGGEEKEGKMDGWYSQQDIFEILPSACTFCWYLPRMILDFGAKHLRSFTVSSNYT